MKRILALVVVAAACTGLSTVSCGGGNAERAENDVKNAGQDLSNGVGTNGKGLENGVGTNKPDGGNTTDKK